ncbi:MAG TPA: DNA-directed RNA polymerase subunit A' [Candidatus Nanoarchaeia archaeon]|nr:DNA-directed RNA polymerase subunit A' [Candidatus Nanoarchaeia archaeon]
MEYIYKKIAGIYFGLLSPKQIKKMAGVKIVTPELYDKEGYPVDGGLMDTRLGVIDPGIRCKTCGEKLKECPGHFGYIELARPIIHIKYIPIIYDLLRSTCMECSRVLLSEERCQEKISKKEVKALKTVSKCPRCETKQTKIKLEKPTTFVEGDVRLSPIEIQARLEKIPNEDLKIFGMNSEYCRPEHMVLTVLPIPPVTIRPSITLESGERSEDDLTHKLGDIVRINQRLFENINAGAPAVIIEDLWDLLQYHVTTYFDNAIAQVPPARHRSGQALKTLTERMTSKEGRFRHNLTGKRVNYAARTVISPDPKIGFNEVGVPLIIAKELTIPERVTEWNINYLKEFITRGPTQYPGANYIIMLDGKKRKITPDTVEQLLQDLVPGCIVERHLMDKDVAVFNRQPSLHKMSFMCHKIRILPGKSFRLNPAICHPYNADFDGDEMNLHIPQTEEARAEAEILMSVQSQIITPKNGLNVIGCTTDPITGNYLLTKDIKMSREDAIQMLYSIGVDDISKLKNSKQEVSGKEIFSVLLPNDFDFIGVTRSGEDVIIKKGQLTQGFIDKTSIGEDNGRLIRSLYAKYGEDIGIDLLGKIFKLGIAVLLKRGFTTSVADTDIPESVTKKNLEHIKNTEEKVQELIQQYKHNKLEAMPGISSRETLERMILQLLNQLRDKIGETVYENISEKNSSILMVKSGAKGSTLNIAQMAACVGQQSLRGSRINDGYQKRTLTIFKRDSLEPSSRGFIYKGYRQGLSPSEYFFHAMTGRDSLMDTALRTPKSGYLYRRLSNALQDLRVEYDSTVRDANKKIIQFKYGDDGIDVGRSEGGSINVKKIVKEVATYG